MRNANILVLVLSGLVIGNAAARAADSGPVIVLPGRHGLPVVINGVDVTGAVIEGDWGLYSPHMVNPTIILAPLTFPGYRGAYYGGYVRGSFFPALGRKPAYVRREIEPPADRALPRPAPSFHRSWSAHSDPSPANLEQAEQPPLVVAPQIYPGWRPNDGPRPKGP